MDNTQYLKKLILPEDTARALGGAAKLTFPQGLEELRALSLGGRGAERFAVEYSVPGRGMIQEAEVCLCKNGISVNFPEDYMRRRDSDSMRIGDALPTDKARFCDDCGYDFSILRGETLAWLSAQALIVMPIYIGGAAVGAPVVLICPENAAFFALALAEMQTPANIAAVQEGFRPRGIIYLAPPFRHTHFNGRQRVIHCRAEGLHEVFAYNLYPGPSAKKGVFSILLDMSESGGRACCHASAALVESPYKNRVVFMHEGASGGGKSEMLEAINAPGGARVELCRPIDGAGEAAYITLHAQSRIRPIGDDMLIAAPTPTGRLGVSDGERAWFMRMDGVRAYGSCPEYERLCLQPPRPLEFFNMDGVAGATCIIWEHTRDADGTPCTNPRAIIPRALLDSLPPEAAAEVNVRSFGVRMPPSTAEKPDYGVMGMVQVLPPALAWLWRLISPRGYHNPSIAAQRGDSALMGEGVGSYWPFATGRRVTQANLLLHQILDTPRTMQLLLPNQHIGAYRVGFAAQKLAREYLARRGGRLEAEELTPARCPLFGWALRSMSLDGQTVPRELLQPELQAALGTRGYDVGAAILTEFFKREAQLYLAADLDPVGARIIEALMDNAPFAEYLSFTPFISKAFDFGAG